MDLVYLLYKFLAVFDDDYVIFETCELYRFVLFFRTKLVPGEQQIE